MFAQVVAYLWLWVVSGGVRRRHRSALPLNGINSGTGTDTSQETINNEPVSSEHSGKGNERMNRPKTLSATFVKSVSRPGRYGDGRGGHGLSLMVRPTKIEGRLSKAWVQRIRINGKETNLGLGSYPAVTLAEARQRALRNRQAVEEGRNPRARKAPTFRQATEKVIRLHAAKWKPGGRSEEHWRSTLQTYAYPRFGNKRVDLITTADVMACLAPQWHEKPETATRVKQRISAVMKWSIAQGFREDNPADDRITAALGSNKQRPQHMKALHHRDMVAAAVRAVEATDAHWATIAAFKFLTLTATRSGEVRNATWDEIDLPNQSNLDHPCGAHQNTARASGASEHRCSGGSARNTQTVRREWSGISVTHRTDT